MNDGLSMPPTLRPFFGAKLTAGTADDFAFDLSSERWISDERTRAHVS